MSDSTSSHKNQSLHPILVFLFWIGAWHAVYLAVGRDIIVPSPVSVFIGLTELILIKEFWVSVGYSMLRVAVGLVLSLFFGLFLGILATLHNYCFDILNPMVSAIKSTPVISFIIIALIWFSSNQVPIFICFLMCFPIIWTNVVQGIKQVDSKLLEMAKIYQVNWVMIYKSIYLPSISPYLTAAFIASLGLGWKVSVAAEVLSLPLKSIGYNVYSAKVYLDSVGLFAWTLVVVILSFCLEKIFVYMIRKNKERRGIFVNNCSQSL